MRGLPVKGGRCYKILGGQILFRQQPVIVKVQRHAGPHNAVDQRQALLAGQSGGRAVQSLKGRFHVGGAAVQLLHGNIVTVGLDGYGEELLPHQAILALHGGIGNDLVHFFAVDIFVIPQKRKKHILPELLLVHVLGDQVDLQVHIGVTVIQQLTIAGKDIGLFLPVGNLVVDIGKPQSHAVQSRLDLTDTILVHSLPLQAVRSSLKRLLLFYLLCGFGV